MEWLNYHHLLYFYTVAREGSVTKASEVLRLAQPTLSGQIRKLEESLDEKLLVRDGRNLALTDVGRMVYRYAEEIFSLGREMQDALRGRPSHRPAKLLVGISDAVPKLVCHRLLKTALTLDEPVELVLHEGKTNDLLAALAVQEYDMVLTDAPLGPPVRVKAYNHSLGGCGIGFFGEPSLAKRHRRRFPKGLDQAPMLLPTSNTSLRHSLDRWFDSVGIRPTPIAEIEDTALMKVFGQHGTGIFAAPIVVADEIRKTHGVHLVGRTEDVREEFYAITVERRITHPAVAAIAEAARGGTLA
ncbi:MAG: transcriptional activator NhaR [Proteobacteria bacterium]|nr:transcriptional activator NhaR [Pseudomonadota bacterium]